MAHDDIVIVGGGIIGVCTAFCLLSHPSFPASGVSVTLVERTSAIASQASGKAGGFLAKDWHGPATSELAESSWALHLEWAERYGGRERWGFRRMTSLGVDLDLGASTGERRPQGNPAFEESELRQKPASKGSPKSEGVGAWIAEGAKKTVLGTEDTTAQVHPRLFTQAIHELATKAGLRTLYGNIVSRDPGSSMLTVLTHSSSAPTGIPCTTLIATAGPWTSQVLSQLKIPTAHSPGFPISNLPGHSVILRPSSHVDSTAVFSTLRRLPYPRGNATGSPEIFPRPDGTVYVAGENDAEEMPLDPNEVDGLVSSSIADRLVRSCDHLSPALKGAEVEKVQLCYRPTTPNGAPTIEKLKLAGGEKVFVAAGHGPWGITLGPGTGMRVAETVLRDLGRL